MRKPIYIFLLIFTSDCNAWPSCAEQSNFFFSPFSSFLCSARFNPLLHHLNLLMLDFYQNTAVYCPSIDVFAHTTKMHCLEGRGKKTIAKM